MNDINHLKQLMDQLDKERQRLRTELAKRQNSLKHYIGELPERVRRIEQNKIEEIADLLEDVEFDFSSVVEDLFNAAEESEARVGEETMEAMLEDNVKTDEYERLEEEYAKAEKDLSVYKQREKELRKELELLEHLIEDAELEAGEILSKIVED